MEMSNTDEKRAAQYVNYFTIALAENGQVLSLKMFARMPDFDVSGKSQGEHCIEVANVVMTAHNASELVETIHEVQSKFAMQTNMEKQHG